MHLIILLADTAFVSPCEKSRARAAREGRHENEEAPSQSSVALLANDRHSHWDKWSYLVAWWHWGKRWALKLRLQNFKICLCLYFMFQLLGVCLTSRVRSRRQKPYLDWTQAWPNAVKYTYHSRRSFGTCWWQQFYLMSQRKFSHIDSDSTKCLFNIWYPAKATV